MVWIQKTVLLTALFFLLATASHAERKQFSQEVDQPFSGSQSPDDARIAAIAKAKLEALEKAGTYIESLTVVENFRLKKDEITAVASGIVRSEIVSQKNYATEDGFGIILVLQLEVDSTTLEKKMQTLAEDQTLIEKYHEIQQREVELLDIIRNLEKQNQALQQQPGQAVPPQKEELEKQYSTTIKALTAAEWNRKAVGLWQNGKYADPYKAVEYLDKSLQLDKSNPKAYNNRGTAYFNLDRINRAIKDYDAAIRMDADYAAAYNNRGIANYHLAEYWKAIEDFNQAIRIQPDKVYTYLFRGAAYKNLYQYQRALNDFSQVLRLSPELSQNMQDRESILLELNELERICGNAKKACDLGLCKAMNYLTSKGFCK
ncbi:MAG: tetratricopeptide repeat protein [Desulfobacteraceae bacterium]|nr:MAG: tetratricopeptide repeat protein [Desulfobacteraceae bacterium]